MYFPKKVYQNFIRNRKSLGFHLLNWFTTFYSDKKNKSLFFFFNLINFSFVSWYERTVLKKKRKKEEVKRKMKSEKVGEGVFEMRRSRQKGEERGKGEEESNKWNLDEWNVIEFTKQGSLLEKVRLRFRWISGKVCLLSENNMNKKNGNSFFFFWFWKIF